MAALVNGLMKMSVRGIVIVLIVLSVRFLLKKLKVGHKYIVGLWAMAFLHFINPWKISLPVGFWGNTAMMEQVWMDAGAGIEESLPGTDSAQIAGNIGTAGHMIIVGSIEKVGNTCNIGAIVSADIDDAGAYAMQVQKIQEAAVAGPSGVEGQNREADGSQKDRPGKGEVTGILAVLWLTGLAALFGHMLYSYLMLKRKLMLRVPYRDNIWWAENIDMPMVFGLLRPQIYLPVTLEAENLTCVIAHEEMHVRRKDGLLKMSAYIICLFHWFNPFIWAAYILFGSDLEKACDEEVIGSMGKEKRKEYAYALVHIAAGRGKGKRRVFVAPIGFGEGNLKSRVKNVMKYKYMPLGIGAVATAVIIALSVLLMTEAKTPAQQQDAGTLMGDNNTREASGEPDEGSGTKELSGEPEGGSETQGASGADTAYDANALPVFFVEDIDSLAIGDSLAIEDCYITNRRAADNHYYIDEHGVLWGTGKNEYGQLGTGTYGVEEYHEEPVKIAEHVVSVDASENAYFCIYLTEDGDLYGLGLNYAGLLLGKGSETTTYDMEKYQRVTAPVLMMTNVVYMRAGRTCVVALQDTQSAYWWGEYTSTTLTQGGSWEDYWKLEEDDTNPVKMLSMEPMHIMDNCEYITTGTFSGAAISKEGELYTWGLNLFGQCGTPVTEDDYIRTPTKVMDGVRMAWVGRIGFNNSEDNVPDDALYYVRRITNYGYNTFVLNEDNTLMAVGLELGDKEKVTQLTGDIREPHTYLYGDSFVPVHAEEYSSNLGTQSLKK